MDFKRELAEAIEKSGSPAKLTEESFLHYRNNYSVLKQSDSLKSLIPGKIYTFFYDSSLKNERDYINHRPVLFLDSREITLAKSNLVGFVNIIELAKIKKIKHQNIKV